MNNMSGADVPSGSRDHTFSSPAAAPVEMIDIIFAISNIRLVREIVRDNMQQLDDLSKVGKGQTEGLRNMIMERHKQVFADLNDVELVLNNLMEKEKNSTAHIMNRNVSLNAQQSRVLVYALSFAINHLLRFIPGSSTGVQLPGSII